MCQLSVFVILLIDTSAQGQSWDNEVINKQQFEDGLRQVEPQLSDEELDELPISAVMDGKVQTFPDAAALDETLNAEPAPEPAGNFRITDDDLGVGGPKQKYARNIEAIRTLFRLEEEHRGATAEEQQVLSQYVGWGGLADAFDPGKDNWAKEYAELKGLLSEDEYAAARSSTLNAHYTSPTVIRSIYDAVGRMGFRSGNILEPSMGVGNFFGMLPDTMQDSRLYGVELDSITGRIAKKLYPQADITVAGFETTDRRDFYDLAVGNVPFGQYRVNDKAYNKLGFSIHNYFFAKAISQSAVVRLFFIASGSLLPKRSRFYVCPLFMAAPDGEISVVFPNFRHFTFYRKFGGYTWALIMVWKRRTLTVSGLSCASSMRTLA